jgi:hypothetical protein
LAAEPVERGVEHRTEMPEVGGSDADLCGENDLAVVDCGLRVVGLPGRCALGAHHPRIRVTEVDHAVGPLRGA